MSNESTTAREGSVTDLLHPELRELSQIAPAGFFYAIRVGFAYPVLHREQFPQKWLDRYTSRGYMLRDPAMLWALENTGAISWRELAANDPHGVLEEARRHGLCHGVTVSMRDESTAERSYGSFTRKDRDFTTDEIERLQRVISGLHAEYRQPPRKLTEAEKNALMLVKDGYLMKEIAALLGVSEGAVKLRLRKAKTKLHAKTSTQAAARAAAFGYI